MHRAAEINDNISFFNFVQYDVTGSLKIIIKKQEQIGEWFDLYATTATDYDNIVILEDIIPKMIAQLRSRINCSIVNMKEAIDRVTAKINNIK